MKRYHLLIFAFNTLLFYSCSSKTSQEKLKEEILVALNQTPGTFAVAFKNLTSGEELLINEHELFHAASTMKTPVMVEVYKQAAAGKFSLEDSIIIINEFKSIIDSSLYSLSATDDSDTLIYQQMGERRTLYSLMYDMIIMSSNLATNLVIEQVGAAATTATMRSIGANNIQVLRGVEDGKAYRAGLNNVTTAYDLLLLFEKIGKKEMVSEEACTAMIDILLEQKFNEIIPAKLPKDVKVAHKTGSISGVRHDSGIVMLPEGKKYVLILLSKELENPDEGIEAMAQVSKLIYDYVSQ